MVSKLGLLERCPRKRLICSNDLLLKIYEYKQQSCCFTKILDSIFMDGVVQDFIESPLEHGLDVWKKQLLVPADGGDARMSEEPFI